MTTPSEPSLVQLWLHGGLDLSEQLQKEPPECPAENVSACLLYTSDAADE